MQWKETAAGTVLRGAQYTVRLQTGETPCLLFTFNGQTIATFPVASAVDTPEEKEHLRNIRILQLEASADEARLLAQSDSNCWETHTFEWVFTKEGASFSQEVSGCGALGRCYFLSGGRAEAYGRGDADSIEAYAHIHLPRYRPMTENLADVTDYDVSHPGYIGIAASEQPAIRNSAFWEHNAIFTPAPFLYAFYDGDITMGIGFAAKPGSYRFNGVEYTGSQMTGAAFYVNYLGYTTFKDTYRLPSVSLHLGWSVYEVLRAHIAFVDKDGYGTARVYPPADWHYAPIFCGWAEQTSQGEKLGVSGGNMATQANYEEWIQLAEARGLPLGTIVIDDKWQTQYGTFEVDTQKWPDMKKFVDAQHAKQRHVLLWVPSYHKEGVPENWCVKDAQDNIAFADPANPEYETFLRAQIRHLVADIGIDGFKEDWVAASAVTPGYMAYGDLHGLELFRRFQGILYEETHTSKPDALVETQTPHPLFRESSDMLRLNDIWFGNRQVCKMMQRRARIAMLAGWDVLDCDNASSTTAEQWFAYAQMQVKLGIPALYFLHETESAHEIIDEAKWTYLTALWEQYVRENEFGTAL